MATKRESPISVPEHLTVADIKLPPQKVGTVDLTIGTDDYKDAVRVLHMYQKQATRLDEEDRAEFAVIIKEARFTQTASSRVSPGSHAMYRASQKKKFADDSLSWPQYLVLYALFGSKIPAGYTQAIKKKYNMLAVKDYSGEYDAAQREAGQSVILYRIDDNGNDVSVYYRDQSAGVAIGEQETSDGEPVAKRPKKNTAPAQLPRTRQTKRLEDVVTGKLALANNGSHIKQEPKIATPAKSSLKAPSSSPGILGVEGMFHRSSSKASSPAMTSPGYMQQSPGYGKSVSFADVKTTADEDGDNKTQTQKTTATVYGGDTLVAALEGYTRTVNQWRRDVKRDLEAAAKDRLEAALDRRSAQEDRQRAAQDRAASAAVLEEIKTFMKTVADSHTQINQHLRINTLQVEDVPRQ